MTNCGVTFRNLTDVASERFSYFAKMTFDLFHLLGIHGLFLALFKEAMQLSRLVLTVPASS